MKNSIVLYVDDSQKIEYFFDAAVSNTALAFVFGPSMNRVLEGNGHGGEVFLENAFDVIAFKTISDDWFQNIPDQIFATIDEFVMQKGYEFKVGYGSSMGGYAGIVFSKKLNLDKVVAFSPQYSIDESFDRRWENSSQQIEFVHRITGHTVSQECKFLILYDPSDLDRLHVEKIQKIIPSGNIQLVRMAYAGHPVTPYLSEIGDIKYIIENIRTVDFDFKKFSGDKRLSHTYFSNLSKALTNSGKIKFALKSINTAISLDPTNIDYQRAKTEILEKLVDDDLVTRSSFATSNGERANQKDGEQDAAAQTHSLFDSATDINAIGIGEIVKQLYLRIHHREIGDDELATVIHSLTINPVDAIYTMLNSEELIANQLLFAKHPKLASNALSYAFQFQKSNLPERKFFLHIPKTGGTSVISYLKENTTFPWLLHKPQRDHQEISIWPFVGAHAHHSIFPPESLGFTIFRDPLERLISAWRFQTSRAQQISRRDEKIQFFDKNFTEYLDLNKLRNSSENYQPNVGYYASWFFTNSICNPASYPAPIIQNFDESFDKAIHKIKHFACIEDPASVERVLRFATESNAPFTQKENITKRSESEKSSLSQSEYTSLFDLTRFEYRFLGLLFDRGLISFDYNKNIEERLHHYMASINLSIE